MNSINTAQQVPGEVRRRPNRIILFFINFLLPLAALACGIAITIYLLKTSPEAKPRKRPPNAILVEVTKVVPQQQQTLLSGMGEITPAKQINLSPRVSGEILEVDPSFIPGGYFKKGQNMVKIDRKDYELVVDQLESQRQQAENDLLVEMGNQRIASKEFALLGESVSQEEKDLILRRPQLQNLEAALALASSKLQQAKLDLERTEINAPFNGVILSQAVNVGARVTSSSVLASFAGTDTFWLRLTIPVEQLDWIDIPTGQTKENGANVRIYSQGSNDNGTYRTGHVIRLDAALESQGRMAQLLVEVEDPLCLQEENFGKPKLLLGSYVRAEIEGKTIATGTRIDRAHLHDGNNVWLMDQEGRLEIRPVKIIFRERDHVIINGDVAEGERLITSQLTSPIPGTPLRLAEDSPAEGTGNTNGMVKGGKKREQ